MEINRFQPKPPSDPVPAARDPNPPGGSFRSAFVGDALTNTIPGTSRPAVPLVQGADQDHDGRIDRATWDALAEFMGLHEAEGMPWGYLSLARARQEVLNALGVPRGEAITDEQALAVVRGKLEGLIEESVAEFDLQSKRYGYKEAHVQSAAQAYRAVNLVGNRDNLEERLEEARSAHHDLAIARQGLVRLSQLLPKFFAITEIVGPKLDRVVHPSPLPPDPPPNPRAAVMAAPPRAAKGPFESRVWDLAKGLLTNGDKETYQGSTEKFPLTSEEFARLVAYTCMEGVVQPEDRDLLLLLSQASNQRQLAQWLQSNQPIDPRKLKPADPEQPDWLDGKRLGVWLDQQLDMTMGGKSFSSAMPSAQVSRDRLYQEARATVIKPGGALNLQSRAGRWAILDRLSQLAQRAELGDNTCAPTSMLALAVNAGPDGLAALAQALLQDNPASEPAKRLLAKLPAGEITLGDLGDVAESLYQTLKVGEEKAGLKEPGLTANTSWDFLKRHQGSLYKLFEFGGCLISLDTDGDAKRNHMAALIPGPGGREMVFEPSESQVGHDADPLKLPPDSPSRVTRHHLLNAPQAVKRYLRATGEYFQVLDPKLEKLLKG